LPERIADLVGMIGKDQLARLFIKRRAAAEAVVDDDKGALRRHATGLKV
jgi:hypothetical protein